MKLKKKKKNTDNDDTKMIARNFRMCLLQIYCRLKILQKYIEKKRNHIIPNENKHFKALLFSIVICNIWRVCATKRTFPNKIVDNKKSAYIEGNFLIARNKSLGKY